MSGLGSQWIRSNYRFGPRIKMFSLGMRETATMADSKMIEKSLATGEPERIEQTIMYVINRFRPDLAGGIVEAIECDGLQWRFTYSHPTFPHMDQIGWLDINKAEPLVPKGTPMKHFGIFVDDPLEPSAFAKVFLNEMCKNISIPAKYFTTHDITKVSKEQLAKEKQEIEDQKKSEGDALMDFFKGK